MYPFGVRGVRLMGSRQSWVGQEEQHAMIRILVCRTCPRYEPRKPGSMTRGAALAMEAKARGEGDAAVSVMAVNCLAGCKHPCNAAVDAPDKVRLRFSRLDAHELQLLFEVADQYRMSSDGNISADLLPEPLRDKLTARSPARIGG